LTDRHVPSCPACWLRWGLANFLLGLNYHPPDLCLLSSLEPSEAFSSFRELILIYPLHQKHQFEQLNNWTHSNITCLEKLFWSLGQIMSSW
jgi:hypothetical protein